MWFLRKLIRRRILRRHDSSPACWDPAWRRLPLLQGLDGDEAARLRALATLFQHEKNLEPAAGLRLTARMRQVIALQACLPILNLGLDWLDGWVAVVVYPDAFVSDVQEQDNAGVMHHYREVRSGESWDRGPLILSWSDIAANRALDGNNVVVHEIAHKLDALDGTANGKPPLHRGMSVQDWSRAFGDAFDDFGRRVDAGVDTGIDPYAASSPAEFFAVLSEVFFEVPQEIASLYPDVYRQLAAFYRQDSLTRLAAPGHR